MDPDPASSVNLFSRPDKSISPVSPDAAASKSRWRFATADLVAAAILVSAFTGMVLMSWRKWGDLIVDYGVQVYLPWQLSLGKVLYQDIHYHMGPLSAYVHAVLFKLFGPGIGVLSIFNLAIVAILTGLIHHLFKKFADPLTATAASLAFLTVFAFGQYQVIGVFNFVAAYHYEMTHGIFLSVLAVHQFARYLENRSPGRLMVIGGLCGLVFLTKTEVFLAAMAAIATGLLLALIDEKLAPGVLAKKVFLFVFSLTLPAGLFAVYFSLHMPVDRALASLIHPWTLMSTTAPLADPFYRTVTGLHDIPGNIWNMVFYSMVYLLLFGSIFLLNHLSVKAPINRKLLGLFYSVTVFGIGLLCMQRFDWFHILKPLPLIMLGCCTLAAISLKSRDEKAWEQNLPLLVFTLFSSLLLLKVLLNAKVTHYGFGLIMPATLLFIKLVLYDLPLWVEKRCGTSGIYRAVSLTLILYFMTAHLLLSSNLYRLKVLPVGQGADQMVAYHPNFWKRDMMVRVALDFIDEEMDAGEGFVAFPKGAMLNYLSRRENTSGYLFLDPFAENLFGETAVLNSLKTQPPPYILFINWHFKEFAKPVFGKDFAQRIFSWVVANYEPVRLIGQKPFEKDGFGIQILKYVSPETLRTVKLPAAGKPD